MTENKFVVRLMVFSCF